MSERFTRALAAIDHANADDPHDKEQLYAERMTNRLALFAPDASEAVQIAARAQHIQRWKIARREYPMDRAGYHRWRTELSKMHARVTAELLSEVGYEDAFIDEVKELLRKKGLRTRANTQLLEDVICLVFLEHYFAAFYDKHAHDEHKLIGIVQKTWAKMSERGHEAALALPLGPRELELIQRALKS